MENASGANGNGKIGGFFLVQNALMCCAVVTGIMSSLLGARPGGRPISEHYARPPPETDELVLFHLVNQKRRSRSETAAMAKSCISSLPSGFCVLVAKTSSNVTLTIVGLPALVEDPDRLPQWTSSAGFANRSQSEWFFRSVQRRQFMAWQGIDREYYFFEITARVFPTALIHRPA